jgi:hypothetical protein
VELAGAACTRLEELIRTTREGQPGWRVRAAAPIKHGLIAPKQLCFGRKLQKHQYETQDFQNMEK